jgi:general secretion pathway protein D
MRLNAVALLVALGFALAGCGTLPIAQPDAHIQTEVPKPATAIPPAVRSVPLPPPPEARAAELRYSVVVAGQPVREVLIAMARETRLNFDIHPGIEGSVTLNAIDQTLKQILTRISKQVDLRWEADGSTISVMPDTPYLRNYRVDYVNMARDVNETMGISTQVISGTITNTTGTTGASTTTSSTGDNNSTLRITNVARHRFWETLERNVKDMLRETDKLLPEGSSETFIAGRTASAAATTQQTTAARRGATGPAATVTPGETATSAASETLERRLTFREAASVIVNPETGIVSVRATSRQHEKVAEFLEQVGGAARRQVVVEATIVEVRLNDQYQSGVDWSALAIDNLGYSFSQNFLGANLSESPFFSLTYNNPSSGSNHISSTLKLLNTFGTTRVLSSPKLMVLNNQTAVMKVVDNEVYFTIQANTTQNQTQSVTTFTSTQNVVPVGFIMNVTPQISEGDMVTLSVRPTVTRIRGFINDPNPALAVARVTSPIPITQTREMESVLKVGSGQTAILGGLMLDAFEGSRAGLPIAARIPLLGDFFSYRDDKAQKSELVIFLRPLVVKDASVETDLASYKRYLPSTEFFRDTEGPAPEFNQSLQQIEKSKIITTPPPDPPPAGGSRP